MWRIFRAVVGKPLRECDRNDGRAIVAYLEDEAADEGHAAKSATLRRRMVPVIAAVNLAIDEGKYKGIINPFASCVPERKDEDERDAFDDNEMKIIRATTRQPTAFALAKLPPASQPSNSTPPAKRPIATRGCGRPACPCLAAEIRCCRRPLQCRRR